MCFVCVCPCSPPLCASRPGRVHSAAQRVGSAGLQGDALQVATHVRTALPRYTLRGKGWRGGGAAHTVCEERVEAGAHWSTPCTELTGAAGLPRVKTWPQRETPPTASGC